MDHGGATTILQRMIAAGIGEERARAHLAAGRVRLAGETVSDGDTPTPWPQRWLIDRE